MVISENSVGLLTLPSDSLFKLEGCLGSLCIKCKLSLK